MSNNSDNGLQILQEIDLTKCRLCQENDGTIEFLTNSILCERILLCTKISVSFQQTNIIFDLILYSIIRPYIL